METVVTSVPAKPLAPRAGGNLTTPGPQPTVQSGENATTCQSAAPAQSLAERVAIRLQAAAPGSYDYKALRSFADSTRGIGLDAPEAAMRHWLGAMIDAGISPAVRERYLKRLAAAIGCESALPSLLGQSAQPQWAAAAHAAVEALMPDIRRVLPRLLSDAAADAALAAFVYAILSPSTSLSAAIMLSVDDYRPQFPQLEGIIRPDGFHHRRRYVFDLGQSRKRAPQLMREVLARVGQWLATRGIHLPGGIHPSLPAALWTAAAKACGISLGEIAAVLPALPPAYSHLSLIVPAPVDPARREAILARVADSLAPGGLRWYALRLRREASFARLLDSTREALPRLVRPSTFFYPQREIARRVDHKIVSSREPVIPDIVFFAMQPLDVARLDLHIRAQGLGWVFRSAATPAAPYSAIDPASMLAFQRMIGIFTPDMRVELTSTADLDIGRRVRITGGIMAGYEGTIYDLKPGTAGTSQLVVRLSDAYAIRAELRLDPAFVEPL